MLAALIIVFREVFEAGLIVGIVLAVTSSVPYRLRWIGGGLFAGLVGACAVAAFAGTLTQLFEGMGQELFNAAILSTAVIMLTWHNVWMARHGREMANELRTMGQAVVDGARPLVALATVLCSAKAVRSRCSFMVSRPQARAAVGRCSAAVPWACCSAWPSVLRPISV